MSKESPRIENGVIKWFCGDAFFIDFEVLDDETGEGLELRKGDSITISFYNRQKLLVRKFVFEGERNCETLTVRIDDEATKHFPVGTYTFCIKYYDGVQNTTSTVQSDGRCEVERCH